MSGGAWRRHLPWVTGFAVAMAFLESAVVVYLRALYYPRGFAFPLVPMDPRIALTEMVREFATLVMLMAPGALLTRSRLERFAWFCWTFAVWDLFYYVFLKVILDWPSSLFTWDVLFLLPTVWVGPVLAPCVICLGLLVLALLILRGRERHGGYRPGRRQWLLLILSAAIMLYTFMAGPLYHAGKAACGTCAGSDFLAYLQHYSPRSYPWPLFFIACLVAACAMVGMARHAWGSNGGSRGGR